MWMNYTEVSSKNLLFENIKSCCKYFFSISQDTILITIIFSITEPIKKHVDQTKYIPHRKKKKKEDFHQIKQSDLLQNTKCTVALSSMLFSMVLFI